MVDNHETTGRKSGEVRGDDSSRAGSRVKEELGKARLEALLLPVDGMGAQESGLGREVTANCAQGSATRASFEALVFGPPLSSPIMGSKELKRAGGLFMQCPSKGLKLKGVVAHVAGPKAGPSTKWWVVDVDCPTPVGLADLDEVSLVKSTSQALDKGPQEKACLLDCKITRRECFSEVEPLVSWETKNLRKQQLKVTHSVTDRALIEEALRYGSVLNTRGKRVYGSSHLTSFSFDQAPEGEYYDHSGALGEEIRIENQMRLTAEDGLEEDGNGCWDLVEFNGDSNKVRGAEWELAMSEPQDFRNEKENRWEESSLAKFSHFLGF